MLGIQEHYHAIRDIFKTISKKVSSRILLANDDAYKQIKTKKRYILLFFLPKDSNCKKLLAFAVTSYIMIEDVSFDYHNATFYYKLNKNKIAL